MSNNIIAVNKTNKITVNDKSQPLMHSPKRLQDMFYASCKWFIIKSTI